MMTATPPSCTWTTAQLARYERLGCYFDRDRADSLYHRDRQAESLRLRELPRRRESRRLERLNREREAIRARGLDLYRRREALYAARAVVIQERIIAEGKIRPPGKTEASRRRYREQIRVRMRNDPAAIALTDRYERANALRERIRTRRLYDELAAGVIGGDDRAARRAKRWAWLQSREEAVDA